MNNYRRFKFSLHFNSFKNICCFILPKSFISIAFTILILFYQVTDFLITPRCWYFYKDVAPGVIRFSLEDGAPITIEMIYNEWKIDAKYNSKNTPPKI